MLPTRWREHIHQHELALPNHRLLDARRVFNRAVSSGGDARLQGGALTRRERGRRGLGLRSGRVINKDKFAYLTSEAFKRHRRSIADWDTRPGDRGFNEEATKKMKKAGMRPTNKKQFFIKCPSAGKYMPMAYQKTVSWLVSPSTPVSRMLVCHRTGSGKTFTMLRCLDNFYSDPRPKILIFPTAATTRNFYAELLKFPNKYRTACLRRLTPQQVKLVIAESEGVAMTQQEKRRAQEARGAVVDFLAMKGNLRRSGQRGYLKAPLRAFSYTRAGGTTVTRSTGPTQPIFKIGYDGRNVFNQKIILMDEFHNLVKPAPAVLQYKHKLDKLADLLSKCKNSVLVGLTATPIVDTPSDGQKLLRIIKGPGGSQKSSEGFISFFDSMPRTIYPETRPCTEGYLANVIKVELQPQSKKKPGNAEKYATKHKQFARSGGTLTAKQLASLQGYCNSAAYYTQARRMSTAGKLSDKTAQIYATKLHRIALDIAARDEKALILIHRAAGYKIMVEIMNNVVGNACGGTAKNQCWVGLYEKTAEAEDKLKTFNSQQNLRGNVMKAMIVDAKEFSEGVSFKGVRRLILVNPAPTYALHKQRIGRALRACAYTKLPLPQRNVTIDMYVATHPDMKTADEIVLQNLTNERKNIETAIHKMFRDQAVDRQVLAPLLRSSSTCSRLPNNRQVISISSPLITT